MDKNQQEIVRDISELTQVKRKMPNYPRYEVVRERKMDKDKRVEQLELFDLYWNAIGMM